MEIVEKLNMDEMSFEEYTEKSAFLTDLGYRFVYSIGRTMYFVLGEMDNG
jgi:hypothetical protein